VTDGESRWESSSGNRGAAYDEQWDRLAVSGRPVHGEADFIAGFEPVSLLDAGCGTGRVAIELATRGVDVVGVDLDSTMLDQARAKAPSLSWMHADLATVDVGREFDVVAMAGNVMLFVSAGTEASVVANLARHVVVGGVMITGFQLGRGYELKQFDADCVAAGLALSDRFATWEADVFQLSSEYAVSAHLRV
jgi:SAM-dependent methyltransferase